MKWKCKITILNPLFMKCLFCLFRTLTLRPYLNLFFQTCDSFSWKKMWFHFWKPWKNYFLTISTVFVLLCNLRLRDVIRAQFCDRISWGKTQDKTWHFGGKSGVCKLDFSNVFSIVKEQDKQKNMLTHCIWWKHINLEQKECFAIKWAINSRNLFDKCRFFLSFSKFYKIRHIILPFFMICTQIGFK